MKKRLIAAIVSTAAVLTVSGTTIASADDRMGGREGKGINSLLSTLVANGTITQSQADSIAKAATDLRGAAITAAQATAQKAKTTERVTNMVNNVKYKGYKGFKGGNRS